MSASEFIILFFLLAGIFYWVDTIFVKEIATQHGKQRCKELGVAFLDATVEITKVRLKRNARGTVKFKRDYSFEFSSDGVRRYTGNITMLGKILVDLEMSAYPETNRNTLSSEQQNKTHYTIDSTVVDISEAAKKNKPPTEFK